MTCIIRQLFHIPCPTCGVTRALLAILRGNISDYCYYNIMAFPLLVATVLMFIGTKRNLNSCKIISYIFLCINVPYYIFRLKLGIIP